jgi:hypothetical protein
MSFWWEGEEDAPQRTRRTQRKTEKEGRRKKIRGGDDGIRRMRGELG